MFLLTFTVTVLLMVNYRIRYADLDWDICFETPIHTLIMNENHQNAR